MKIIIDIEADTWREASHILQTVALEVDTEKYKGGSGPGYIWNADIKPPKCYEGRNKNND